MLPADVALGSRPGADASRSMVPLWKPSVNDYWLLYDWSTAGKVVFSRDGRVLMDFDPKTKASRFVLALRDSRITFNQ